MDPLEILIAVVVAGAAILAFLVQRARYLREIEPDLELISNEEVSVPDEEWRMVTRLRMRNTSTSNHAENINLEVEFGVYPSRKDAFVASVYPEPYDCIRGSSRPNVVTPPDKLLAGREVGLSVLFYFPSCKSQQLASLNLEDAGFWARISVEYWSKPEFLLGLTCFWKLLNPSILRHPRKWGREKYSRSVQRYWGFEPDPDPKEPYVYKPWMFPFPWLRITDMGEVDTC